MYFKDSDIFSIIGDGDVLRGKPVIMLMDVAGSVGWLEGGARVWFEGFIVHENALAAERFRSRVGRHGLYYSVRQVDGQKYTMKANGLMLGIPTEVPQFRQ